MDLASFLQKLENNLKSAIGSTETDKMNFYHLCNTLTLKFISSHKVNYIEKLQGLVVAFIVYSKMRTQQLARKNLIIAMNYLTNLAVETGRLVLGYEYTTLATDSPTKSALLSTISNLEILLESIYDEWKLLTSLHHLIKSGWNHDMLIKLINGDPVSDEEGLTYLKKEEHPRLLRLRLDLLMSHNCPEYASNFLLWLLKCDETKDDPYLMYLRLSHLCITGQLDEFYKKCMDLSCVTACKVMTNSLIHPHHCFSTSCTSLLLSRVLVNMTVIHDEYFCNKDIMKFWVKTEHLYSKGNHSIFMKNINEYARAVKEPKFIVNLVEILHQEYQKQYTSLCTTLIMRALVISRHAYDKARLYLPETFSNQSALRCMLALLHLLEKLYCDNMLIRVYCQLSNLTLMPCDAIYFAVEKTCTELQIRYNIKNNIESFNLVNGQLVSTFIKTPVEKSLYNLLKNYVDRFNHKRPWLWNESMKSSMLALMSDAGWIFDAILKRFRRTRVPSALMVVAANTTHNTNATNNTNGMLVNVAATRSRSVNGVRNHRKVKNKRRVFKETDLTYNPSKSMSRKRRKTRRTSRSTSKKKRRFKMVDESDDEDDDGDGYGRTTSRSKKNKNAGEGGDGDDGKDVSDRDEDLSDTDIDKTDSDMNETELDDVLSKDEDDNDNNNDDDNFVSNSVTIKSEPITEERKVEIASTTHSMVLRNGKVPICNITNGETVVEKKETTLKSECLKSSLSSPRVRLTRINDDNATSKIDNDNICQNENDVNNNQNVNVNDDNNNMNAERNDDTMECDDNVQCISGSADHQTHNSPNININNNSNNNVNEATFNDDHINNNNNTGNNNRQEEIRSSSQMIDEGVAVREAGGRGECVAGDNTQTINDNNNDNVCKLLN
ncbi:hypothetical protein HELRODRAFT_188893 [Helobdella robusta]|uniref:Uncharacterized protein n=1 Tax=Helobdella robusta TaxID=6412 RepID=T1FQG3_HELRO|nr:hypothetical protein HELRODRAFT_188893 [Helobdella robusta]ESN98741.1 hypothetical protein HELRODRAFT_188893 [Helobdella robusta]